MSKNCEMYISQGLAHEPLATCTYGHSTEYYSLVISNILMYTLALN